MANGNTLSNALSGGSGVSPQRFSGMNPEQQLAFQQLGQRQTSDLLGQALQARQLGLRERQISQSQEELEHQKKMDILGALTQASRLKLEKKQYELSEKKQNVLSQLRAAQTEQAKIQTQKMANDIERQEKYTEALKNAEIPTTFGTTVDGLTASALSDAGLDKLFDVEGDETEVKELSTIYNPETEEYETLAMVKNDAGKWNLETRKVSGIGGLKPGEEPEADDEAMENLSDRIEAATKHIGKNQNAYSFAGMKPESQQIHTDATSLASQMIRKNKSITGTEAGNRALKLLSRFDNSLGKIKSGISRDKAYRHTKQAIKQFMEARDYYGGSNPDTDLLNLDLLDSQLAEAGFNDDERSAMTTEAVKEIRRSN